MAINRRTSLPLAFRCARGPHADSLEQYWTFCFVNKSILWCEVWKPLSCCLLYARSFNRFSLLARCFARLLWEQSALVTIIFPVSSGFPPGSVLVGSPLNKVDLRASPGFYESKGGTVVRALASHQVLASTPYVGLSLLLVLSFAPRGFSPGSPVFPSP